VTVRWVAVVLLLAFGAGRAAAQEFDPKLTFQTVRTDHFRFHFHESARPLVDQLIPAAEAAWARFHARGADPPRLTEVVVADQSDVPNGSATPLPRNRIVLFTAAPTPGLHLNPVGWLETVFVHEFTHIVQLNRSRGWAAAGRAIFGRAPWVFPNLFLPVWQIEGLATFEESRGGHGRLQSGAFRVLTQEAARTSAVPPLDRVNGGVSDWPWGFAPYAWGADFHAFLAQRHGAASLDELTARTSSSLPWLGARAFRQVYGQSLGNLWRDYRHVREGDNDSASDVHRLDARRLTFDGHLVGAARFAAPLCPACEPELVYSVQSPHERPAIYRRPPGPDGHRRRVTTRFGGSTLAIDRNGRIYFEQVEAARNSGRYGDLYVFDPAGGRTRRLTRERRLLDPDVSADGGLVVAVEQTRPGSRALVVLETVTGSVRPLVSADGNIFSTPRLSPDGSTVVAVRQIGSNAPDLVLVDVESGAARTLAAGGRSTWATPTWHPDGRRIIVSRSIDNAPFNLVEIDIDTHTVRPLTSAPSGALWPEVSPDSTTIVYTGYTTDGYDLFAIDYQAGPPVSLSSEPAADPATPRADLAVPRSLVQANHAPYRPWSTFLPTSWTPMIEADDDQIRAGLAAFGRDVLGYHAWSLSATWQVAHDFEEHGFRDAPDWRGSYVYQRSPLQPFLAAWRDTDGLSVLFTGTGRTQRIASVERGWQAGMLWRTINNRRASILEGSIVGIDEEWQASGRRGLRSRSGFRAAWRYTSAYEPGYGISAERGVGAGTAVEVVTPRLGATASGGTVTADVRAYIPAAGRHDVIAIRGSMATTWGSDQVRRAFSLGGSDPAPPAGTVGSDAGPLLRGFSPGAFIGRHATGINIDYRFPLARPQRGIGTWPALLHSIHAAATVDLAHAWIDRFESEAFKTSVGGELSADVVLGYAARFTVSGGISWGHDRASGSSRWSPTVYARVGRAF
jgi:hypothetical protein